MIDPEADVAIVVSPTTLLDPNRYVCEVCYKGFPRKQNLTLHGRAHNLPFTLKTRTPKDPVPRKVYLCPEPTCVHHNRSHALGDFGGLRKHYLRKHCTEKNYKCDTCCKAYTVESDLRPHSKTCGAKKYICHWGCCFSRGYSFTVHKENCDAPEVSAAKYPQTLNIGDNSVKSTENSSSQIGSIMPYLPTLGMGDNSIRFNSNENSLMANPSMDLNFSKIPPTFFSPSSTHQNQHECPQMSDIGLYADLLMDKIPLHNVNLEAMSIIGDGGTSYRTGEGSNSLSNVSFMFDHSSSLNLTQAMHNTSQNGMLNPVSGSSDGRSYGHDSCYGYGYGSGNLISSSPIRSVIEPT
ncbi:hypothetical protein L1987_57312 [Smallanthus sonchifolius]|uniref:Uncharacterized protein n=1 Tax=Smallanthus sonchifolius TaxID=185202 RepID=A0ACB9DCR8_9ASTR|nr:hypothetical protein L1987_57312 [Smallanthus sonchifolius]